MDSIKSQAINMSQTSKHIRVAGTDVATAGTYTYDIRVPKGAIVDKVNAIVKTAFDSATSASLTAGDIATADKFLAATNVKSAAAVESAIAKRMGTVTAYTGGDAGENEYIVRFTLTTAGATSAGEMWVWVDYRFDPNVAYS